MSPCHLWSVAFTFCTAAGKTAVHTACYQTVISAHCPFQTLAKERPVIPFAVLAWLPWALAATILVYVAVYSSGGGGVQVSSGPAPFVPGAFSGPSCGLPPGSPAACSFLRTPRIFLFQVLSLLPQQPLLLLPLCANARFCTVRICK